MTVVVTHTTPADSTFSSTGAAAWNADHALSGVGTMAEQNKTSVDIEGGTIDNTVIGNTTPAAGTFTTVGVTTSINASSGSANADLNVNSKGTGNVNLGTGNGTQFRVESSGSAATDFVMVGGSNISRPFIRSASASGNIDLAVSSQGTGAVRLYTNFVGQEQARVSHTASAVNYVQVTGSATLTGGPTISAQGSDFNIPLRLQSKGISAVELGNPAGWAGFTVTTTNNPNRIALNAPATGFIPTFTTAGVDTNAGMAFISKGTGAIDLAAGSSGVNISNGGTVTVITRTALGSYTANPTLAISAPTTAGGVQATANAIVQNTGATIAGGGTGYTVGDTISMVGGTLQAGLVGTFTVATVSGGVITAVNNPSFSQYSTTPTNPVSVTGGTGSGATLNVTYIYGYPVITNAGSGYVEQPTVTFSGGGGSGAAAYASVGSGTVVRSIGSTMDFYTPSGRQFQVSEAYTTAPVNYVQISGRVSGAGPVLSAVGADTNITMNYVSKGTGDHFFITNSGSVNQFRVAHTASAVNYVQVTGAATGGRPTLSAQGSDSSIGLTYVAKGTGSTSRHAFQTGSGTQFLVVDSGVGTVNTLQVYGSASGSAPVLSSQGSDTNIDLTLTPKGTGNVRFGTYTGTILTPTGYVEIKDSGGTVRRLLVG